jgi:hypothetical protein
MMGQLQEITAGNTLLRCVVLLLAVAAVIAAMAVAMSGPAFAKGPGTDGKEIRFTHACEKNSVGPSFCLN